MKAEGVRELAGMLFFQSTLRLRCILQAVRNIMAMSTYLRRLDGGGGGKKKILTIVRSLQLRAGKLLLILSSG